MARVTYLNTLPDDSLRLVLRYLSCRPLHRNWRSYVSALSVNTALDVGGALARAASLEFCSIGGQDGVSFDATRDASILRPLVQRLPLRRLVLELRGADVLADLLCGCGGDLRELVVKAGWVYAMVTETDIRAIATHCTNLSLLAIHGNHVGGTLAPIWRSLGSTLKQIYIGWNFSTLGSPDLLRHCVNLRRVDVLTMNHAIADVLVALGGRVRVLGVEDELGLNMAPWRQVHKACTSLEAVHLKLYASGEAIDVLSLMRTKLASLTLHNPMPSDDRFFSVLSACSALKELELLVWVTVRKAVLRSLFESLRSVTTVACILSVLDVNPKEDVVDVVAGNLARLESFSMSTCESLRGEDVAALVALPRLKSVTLRHRFSEKSVWKPPEKCAVEVVNTLRACAQLVLLDIDDINIKKPSLLVAEAALAYGRKDFDMFVGGVQYRTC